MKLRTGISPQAGFSLVEVMVALIVVSVGMLGIAKMQALALASTGTAKMRSLAAIQAASLAATMHADRAYWAGIGANLTVTVLPNGTITGNGTQITAPASHCSAVATPCTSAQIAAQDLSDWAAGVNGTLPNDTATITCNIDATGSNPVNCTIQLVWTENVVALNTSSNAAATAQQNKNALAATAQTQYTLYVEP